MNRLGAALSLTFFLFAPAASGFVWPNTAERIEKQLGHGDPGLRRQAAERLDELPAQLGRRLVRKALDDTDAEVRLAAADAARELGVPNSGERVISWLNDPDRRVRLAAAQLLKKSPTPRAVPSLGRVLSDPDADVRAAAADALGASATKEAALPLLGHLDDSLPQVRRAVVLALAELGDRRAVVPLIGKIQDARPQVRQAVARALGQLGDPRASSALVLALRDNDESVRMAALESLAELGDKQAILAIISLLEEDASLAVRSSALDALARIGSKEGLEALLRALGREDPNSAEAPARAALIRLGERAVPRLLECLVGQPPAALAGGCALALAKIGSKRAAVPIVEAMRRGVVQPRAGLIALGELGAQDSLPIVLEHLAFADPLIRRSAIDAAALLLDPRNPDGRAVEPIVRALDTARSSKAERIALVSLLGRTGSRRAVSTLAPLVEGADDLALRVAAIEATGNLGAAGQELVLLAALDDEEPAVRLAAAMALSRSATAPAARALLDRLEHAAEQDRIALAIALGGALSRVVDPRPAERAERLMLASDGGERDALIEAIGRIRGKNGSERLIAFAERAALVADRAKVAESLASHPEAVAALRRLSGDADGSVRANAVWSLGGVAGADEIARLAKALRDRDVAVAGNAAAALGRVALRLRAPAQVVPALCTALAEPRAYVRANALQALAMIQRRCPSFDERVLLLGDRSHVVRKAVAELLLRVPSKQPQLDRVALQRCTAEEPNGAVAAACIDAPARAIKGSEPVTVYVVPISEASPIPRAPFSLVLANGLMRLGVSDRRGAVFEVRAPIGFVSLAVPAPLAR